MSSNAPTQTAREERMEEALERTIHEEVRREDESLVGRIAISYEAAS